MQEIVNDKVSQVKHRQVKASIQPLRIQALTLDQISVAVLWCGGLSSLQCIGSTPGWAATVNHSDLPIDP